MKSRGIFRVLGIVITVGFMATILFTVSTRAGYRPLATEVSTYEQSSDGKWVVFKSIFEPFYDLTHLYRVPVLGGTPIRVDTAPNGWTGEYLITPDNQFIVWNEYPNPYPDAFTRLQRAPLTGGIAETLLQGQLSSLLLTPDGQTIVTIASNRTIYRVALNSGNATPLSVNLASYELMGPITFSPDSRWLAFVGVDMYNSYQIVIASLTTNDHTVIGGIGSGPQFPLGLDMRLAFSPDSERLLYSKSDMADTDIALFSSTLDGTNHVRLVSGQRQEVPFVMTPDGENVVVGNAGYPLFTTTTLQIQTIPIAGGTPIVLYERVGKSAIPYLSPSGEDIVFTIQYEAEPSQTSKLFHARVDGSTPPLLLFETMPQRAIDMIRFTPNGEHVLFMPHIGDPHLPLYSVAIDGSAPAHLLTDRAYEYHWGITPDSTGVYAVTALTDTDLLSYFPIAGGTSIPINHAPSIRLTPENFGEPTILSDGRLLFTTSEAIYNPFTAVLHIGDSLPSRMQFAGATALAGENEGPYTTTVTLSAAQPTTITAEVNAVGGTATIGADYTFTPLTITFAPGDMSAPVPITILEDSEAEPDETVILEISTVQGGVVGTPLTQTITIAEAVYRQWMPITSHNR